MSPSGEHDLFSILAEIRSDLRQIKSDIQSLLTLLAQQQRATSVSSTAGDDATKPVEGAQSGSPEDVLRYLRKMRGEDDIAE